MNHSSLFYYGMACFSLTLLGLLVTVLEFRRTSPSKNRIDLTVPEPHESAGEYP